MTIPYRPNPKVSEAILAFHKQSYQVLEQQWRLREQFRSVDLAYQREVDMTEEQAKAKAANKRGDTTKFQNITMPIVMPQIEHAVTFQQSVFLSGFPIFGVVSSPEHADAALQMDTILGEEQVHANWVPNILTALRNGFKYNLGAVEVEWARETSFALDDPSMGQSNDSEAATNRQKEIIWEGNRINALDMYNTFFDTRVPPEEIPKHGEFAGYLMLKSRIALKQYLAELPTRVNVKEALESGFGGPTALGASGAETYYMPHVNPDALFDTQQVATTDWMAWAGVATGDNKRIKYKNMYEVTVLYGRIMPDDFGIKDVPARNTPQVWKFIIVNGQVVVYAERMTNMHNLIPMFFARPLDDGLGYQTKSMAKNVEPFQEITTALANSIVAGRRRAVSDRMIYDPSRVSAGAMRTDSPVAKIPLRPSAFGTNPQEAVFQIPYRDDQFSFTMESIGQFRSLANETSGLNPARQGQFVKGNKTRFEFAETMGNANGRDQTIALTLEGNFFHPIKEVIKSNILQYQGGVRLFNREQNVPVQVDPITLRKAKLEFKVSDGLLPSDKMIDGDSFQMFLQTIASAPQLAAGYNIGPMISYLMKSRGANLQPFEKSPEQQAYEGALQQWQQAMAMVAAEISKLDQAPTPEQLQEMLPPQPTPEEFGYDPQKPNVSLRNDGTSVYQRYAGVMQQQQQAAAGPQGGAGGGGIEAGAQGQQAQAGGTNGGN